MMWFGTNDVRLVDTETPEVRRNDDVVIRPEWCAICSTDLLVIEGNFPLASRPPKTLGHEYSGTVVDVGVDVTTIEIGERVVCGPVARCGVCHFCRTGREQLCTGFTSLNGAFAEYVCVPERAVHRLPNDISMEIGALVEPVACCIHGIEMANVTLGDTVVIIGAGAIGQILAQLAKYTGAGVVIVSEPNAFRRGIAQQICADIVVDPLSQDLKTVVDAVTSGRGPDIVIEAIGSSSTCAEALRIVGRGGKVIFFGCAPPEQLLEIRPWDLYAKEIVMKAVKSSPYAFKKAIQTISRLDLMPIITHKYSLDKIHEALDAARSLAGLKVLVGPGGAPFDLCQTGGVTGGR